MRDRLISTGCKAAVAGGKRRKKKSYTHTPRQNLPKAKDKEESKSAFRREETLDTCSAPRRDFIPASQPVARTPAARAARAEWPAWAGVGRGRRRGRRPARPAPGSHTAPRHLPVLSSLSAAEVFQHGGSGEGKIWIKQSPLRNGRRKKCQCRGPGAGGK